MFNMTNVFVCFFLLTKLTGIPGWLSGKESASANAGDAV